VSSQDIGGKKNIDEDIEEEHKVQEVIEDDIEYTALSFKEVSPYIMELWMRL